MTQPVKDVSESSSPPIDGAAPFAGASPLPASTRLPGAKRRRRGRLLLIIAAVVVAVGGLTAYALNSAIRPGRVDLVTHTVRYDRLELTVVERGALESSDNNDIYCRVKAGAKNSTVSSTIKSLVDDGSTVKKGELLVELDDSGLQEQLKTEKITLDTAESNKIQAEEQYKITVSQNESDIKNAETALELARIDLQKYQEGDYPQALKDVEGRIKTSESDVEQQRDRSSWAARMVKKGYQTVSQAQAEQSKLESLEIAKEKVKEELRVLTDPVFGLKKRTETDLANKMAVAEKTLLNVKLAANAKEVKDRTDRDTKRSIWEQEKTHYQEILDEIKKCKIYAPQDGMVVYFIPEQARWGGGAQQSIVAQGEPVREGQKLMQIPDLRHMLVNTKVHEAMVSRVKRGQRVLVRIDADADHTYHAHIDSVATISAQQDFMAADVKVYTTKVAIEEEVSGLKPGMSAQVTITVGDPLERVLTVPVEAIVGSVEMGGTRRVYVMNGNTTTPRDVVVGLSNDRMVEIRDGLSEGEKVVLNTKAIVGDTLKTRHPGAERDHGGPSSGEPGKGKGKPKDKTPSIQPEGGPSVAPQPDAGPSRTPDDRQKMQQEMAERYRKASPEERKAMLEKIPEEFRDKFKAGLKE
jgi:multidrug resistance efflux pump